VSDLVAYAKQALLDDYSGLPLDSPMVSAVKAMMNSLLA